MAFPQSSMGLVPWMNARASDPSGLPSDTVISFPVGGNIIVKWLEDGTYTNNQFYLQNLGRWGTDLPNDYHYTVAIIASTYPGTTNYTVANRTALLSLAGMQEYNTALVTSDNSYWEYLESKWIRIIQKVNIGTTTAYSITATIFTATFPLDDLAKVLGIGIKEGGYYDLCWNGNGLHATVYDATFNVNPAGYRIYDEIPDRTELNTRVAGEKALFEDEFITASQIEAGLGVNLKWRNTDGSLTGYTTDAVKGANLVLESSGIIYTQGAKSNAGVYYEEQTSYIQFRDKSFIHPVPNDSKIPIEFDLYKENGTSVISANAINNNLYALRKNILNVVNYPLGAYGDQTVNYIQFIDTVDVTWTVTGSRTTINTPEGLVSKKGINVSAVITYPTGYSGWNITDADTPSPTIGFVSDNDTVTFDGTNGVAVQVTTLSATDHKVEINRPLQLQEDGSNVGTSATTTVNFDSNSETSTAYPINFVVSNISTGERRVRAYAGQQTVNPSNEVWVKHWWNQNQYADLQIEFSTTRDGGPLGPFQIGDWEMAAGALSFSPHGFWQNGLNFIGQGEIVAQHSGVIQALGTPPTFIPSYNFVTPQANVDYMFAPVVIQKTGCYLVHTVIQGLSSPNLDFCTKQVPFNNHELGLHYFVERSGSLLSTYCLDHKSNYHPGSGVEWAGTPVYYPGQFSTKWSLQGTAILALEAGDNLFGQFAVISYYPYPWANKKNAFPRVYKVNYITQHIELVSQKTLTTNLYPHNNPLKVLDFFDFTV